MSNSKRNLLTMFCLAAVAVSSSGYTQDPGLPIPQDPAAQLNIKDLDIDDTELALRAALLVTQQKEKQLFILQALAELFHDQNRFEEERDVLLNWISLAEQLEHFPAMGSATQHLRLSYAYFQLKEYDKAETAAQKSLKMFLQCCGENSSNVALALNNLAWVQMQLEKYDEAEANTLKSLAILKDVAGEKSIICGLITENLGALYARKKEHVKAVHYLKSSLRVLKNFLYEEDEIISQIKNKIREENEQISQSKQMAGEMKIKRRLAGKKQPNK